MKISVLCHLDSETHSNSRTSLQRVREKEKESLNAGKQCCLNCASAAYTCTYKARLSYEHHIPDIYTSGGLVGAKHHSKVFPETFLPHLYVIRSDVSNFVVSNKLPFGLMADKMTSKHLTRHMVGIRIPIWDIPP